LAAASAAMAQQRATVPQAPATMSQPAIAAAPPASAPVQAPAAAVAPAVTDAAAAPPEREGRLLKAAAVELREFSPWSMFLSADVVVKAVMIGLAFASLVTWTIFIAKMIELSVVQRNLRAALGKIADARSLAEAQFALGSKGSVLFSLLAAAMREARMSAGISSDAGIKERAASSFGEIVRAEARRIRLGMGLLATIGAFFSFCEERYGIAHPCRHMKRRGGARERERFLSDDELRRALPVMRELGYPRGDVMLFSLLTGRRLREVTDMTWSEVDLVARVHHLPASHSKNRKAHTVPLSAGAVDVFKAAEGRKVGGGEYVFHGTRDRPIVEILWQVNKQLSVQSQFTYVFVGPFGHTPPYIADVSYVAAWVTYRF